MSKNGFFSVFEGGKSEEKEKRRETATAIQNKPQNIFECVFQLFQYFKHFYGRQCPPPLTITFRAMSKVVKQRRREGGRLQRPKVEFKHLVFEARAYCPKARAYRATAAEQAQGEEDQEGKEGGDDNNSYSVAQKRVEGCFWKPKKKVRILGKVRAHDQVQRKVGGGGVGRKEEEQEPEEEGKRHRRNKS